MLTRLEVSGFKNLEGLDVRFGPFTCIAGPNGVGKSNVFDAVTFLAALADGTLVEAAARVRGGGSSVAPLFRRGGDRVADEMQLAVEFVAAKEGRDALGQHATARATWLRYELALRLRPDARLRGPGALEIVHERLSPVQALALPFPHTRAWAESAVFHGDEPLIETVAEATGSHVVLHGADGRARRTAAAGLPRTVLSSVNDAGEHATAALARQEIIGWTRLHLEPSALRGPDAFTAPRSIGPDGAGVAGTLYRLGLEAERDAPGGAQDVYAAVANRLAELVDGVRAVSVDVDDERQRIGVVVTDRRGTRHAASALSDGTLRFLALAVMEADAHSGRVVCLEEPENGVHPARIPAMVGLLEAMAVDPDLSVDRHNPLRQVIVNTHSPSTVAYADSSSLLLASEGRMRRDGAEEARLVLRHLPGTWRGDDPAHVASRGDLAAFLNPLAVLGEPEGAVLGRPDLQRLVPLAAGTKA